MGYMPRSATTRAWRSNSAEEEIAINQSGQVHYARLRIAVPRAGRAYELGMPAGYSANFSGARDRSLFGYAISAESSPPAEHDERRS